MDDRKSLDYDVFVTIDRWHRKMKHAIRTWEPGDGVRCSSVREGARIPCGPPVAVVVSQQLCNRPDLRYRTIRRIACANHLPGLAKAPGDVSAEATRAATERIVAEHWGEFQAYVRAETEKRLTEVFEFADETIRRFVLDACQASDDDR